MRQILMILLSCCSSCLFAQQLYQGQILDGSNKAPLPYVNVGIVNKQIGTVTDEDGRFTLPLNLEKFQKIDTLQISSLGYRTLTIPVSAILKNANIRETLFLTPSDIQLNEVILSAQSLVPITEYVGYRNYGEDNYGYWNKNIALGGELATKIKVNNDKRQLNSLEFDVIENQSDSVLVRVNIYDAPTRAGIPGTNLNYSTKNILYTIPTGKSSVTLSLAPYEIYVQKDFFVSLELLKVYGNKALGLVLAAAGGEGSSYRKYASQGQWEFLSGTPMAYYLETSPYLTQKKAAKWEAKVERIRQKDPLVSGYAILRGIMIPEVTVINRRTRQGVVTDDAGRYEIRGKRGDILSFSKKGYKNAVVTLQDQTFVNALLQKVSVGN